MRWLIRCSVLLLLLLPSAALPADNAPFYQMGDPYFFPARVEAAQFPLAPPKGATSYRLVNPCHVDVRVRKASSMDEQVTLQSGTRYLSRTSEVVASSRSTYISLIAVDDPGSGGCVVEIQYGTGY